MLSNHMRTVIRDIAHGDTPRLARIRVYVVKTHRSRREQFQFWKLGDDLFRKLRVNEAGNRFGFRTHSDQCVSHKNAGMDYRTRKTALHERSIFGINFEEDGEVHWGEYSLMTTYHRPLLCCPPLCCGLPRNPPPPRLGGPRCCPCGRADSACATDSGITGNAACVLRFRGIRVRRSMLRTSPV